MSDLRRLDERLRAFVSARDWEQFHSPKNLSMALTVEAAELQEVFQWLTEDESRSLPAEPRKAAEEELADVFIYALRMAQVLGIDLVEAAMAKMDKNERKYPVEQARGSARKLDAS
jgi:dCTP diphosphatase